MAPLLIVHCCWITRQQWKQNQKQVQVQEAMGNICLITANISQAKTHFKKAMKIYENVWADEPELIEEKYQEIQELYPQVGIALARGILASKNQ